MRQLKEASWFSAVELHFIFSSPMTSANRWCAKRTSNNVFRFVQVCTSQVVLSLGAVDVKPLITRTFEFER
ncbi:hypothetical protein X736_31175 [Mesorhizobium sp. L2C089B000]|nr:hypothetical protein X736_31175 [Mesorhizobium sp. L2C089B000]